MKHFLCIAFIWLFALSAWGEESRYYISDGGDVSSLSTTVKALSGGKVECFNQLAGCSVSFKSEKEAKKKLKELQEHNPNLKIEKVPGFKLDDPKPTVVEDCSKQSGPVLPPFRLDWGHQYLEIPQAWTITKGKGSLVFIFDTGLDTKHVAFPPERVKGCKDFSGKGSCEDGEDHGTHVAGIIGAAELVVNGVKVGAPGVAPESWLYPLKVLDDNGSGTFDKVAEAIAFATGECLRLMGNYKKCIFNFSMGGNADFSPMREKLLAAVNLGVYVSCAAGNNGGTPIYPAVYCPFVNSAINKLGQAPSWSNKGGGTNVASPGVDIYSTVPGDQWATLSGTSMATPYTSGVLALLVSAGKQAALCVKQVLGLDPAYGKGRPDAPACVGII